MLTKLLKYDLKWIYKVVGIFYVLALIFSLIARIYSLLDNSLLFSILYNISSSACIAMLISTLINTLMRSWVRFVRNIYKDESYLTHTLPVEKKTIYLSKVLASIIAIFTTTLVLLLCLFICYYSKDNLMALKYILNLTANTYDTTVINLLLVIAIVFFLEIVYILLVGYVGIIVGHRKNNNRMARSVIFGLFLYLLTQGATLLILFIVSLFNKDIMDIISVINSTTVINVSSIKTVILIGIGIYVIYNIIYYLIGKRLLEKGVNVD